jgi:signal peptidase
MPGLHAQRTSAVPDRREPSAGPGRRGALHLVGAVLASACLAVTVLLPVTLVLGTVTGKWRVVTVVSDSMKPAMPVGSLLLVTSRPATELAPGDVLVYDPPVGPERTISHRVVSLAETSEGIVITTKGDANATPDPWRAVVGRQPVWTVAFAVPHLGLVPHLLGQVGPWTLVRYGLPGAALAWLLQGLATPSSRRRPRGRHAARAD